jgi:DNA-binding FrmR family transcriptional regulator
MDSIKSNNTIDIEVLKQKLSTYRQSLETLKSESVVEDYILLKNESTGLKNQVSKVEGELRSLQKMNDIQLTDFKKKFEDISDQFETIHQSLNQLKEQVALITRNVDNINIYEFLKKIEEKLDTKNEPNSSKEEKSEIAILKEEIVQLKKQQTNQLENNYNKTTPNLKPSSFNQLKNMIQSSKSVYSPLNSQRRLIDGYRIQGNPFQPTTNIKRNSMINPISQQSGLDDQTVALKTGKDDEAEQQQENSPQSNLEDYTLKQNPKSSNTTEINQPNETHENMFEISTDNEVEDKEDIANNALNEQFMHTEQNTLLPDQKKQLGHTTLQSTSKPVEVAESSLDKSKKMEVEEKPSFLSFLQRSKYFGK